ncbi:MAG TPA: helix-turn-helix transcriptional regulator [Propionibacteriaceae bacterium]|nr:helix-turn-helix transcriptional regulator [Propionibacteriaceae bacterium]
MEHLIRAAERGRRRNLTRREEDVLKRMLEGLTDGEIGEELFLSTQTVAHHFRRILRRLDLPGDPTDDRRVQAVVVWLLDHADEKPQAG